MDGSANDIEALNELIGICLDSERGYKSAVDHTNNGALKSMFNMRAVERRAILDELQQLVRDRGGEPEDEGSLFARFHRTFMDLKSRVMDRDEAVIEEIERGEDRTKEKFEWALREVRLSSAVREAVERHYIEIKAAHDQVSALKHAVQ